MKTSELEGAALDWAVSLITNPEWSDEDRWYNTLGYVDCGDPDDEPYTPSTDWAQGGPIIEQERICLIDQGGDYWQALWGWKESFGPTPLIAAMRCYVASRIGDEVDIPKELGEVTA